LNNTNSTSFIGGVCRVTRVKNPVISHIQWFPIGQVEVIKWKIFWLGFLTVTDLCLTNDHGYVPCAIVISRLFLVHDLSLNVTYHRIFNTSNTTDAANEAGGVGVVQSLFYCVSVTVKKPSQKIFHLMTSTWPIGNLGSRVKLKPT
jgi:hypothetical protein